MNRHTTNFLYTLIVCFVAWSSTNAMEYPQLQLETPKKQSATLRVDCSIMIPDETEQLTAYAMKTVHAAIFKHSNVESTIKDPIILFHVQKNSAPNQFYLPLPAKLFINCTDKSLLQIHETDGSQLFKSHPIFQKKQLLINAVCKKNPKLDGNSFDEQFNNTMNEFYTDPGVPWVDEEHRHKLETAGIMTTINASIPVLVFGQHGPTVRLINRTTFAHGPNGCPNEKVFIQSIIDEQMPTNKKIFNSLMNRQITGK
jgi:hypothetical protein